MTKIKKSRTSGSLFAALGLSLLESCLVLGCSGREVILPPSLFDGSARDVGIDSEMACGEVRLDIQANPVDVLLLIDRSGSMTSAFVQGLSRWDAANDALFSTANGLVDRLPPNFRVGAAWFTDGFDSTTCLSMISEWPSATSRAGLRDQAYSLFPGSGTTVPQALAAVREHYQLPSPGAPPLVVVAVLDGDIATQCQDNMSSLDEASRLHAMGINTYVLGVGDGTVASALQTLANVGAGQPIVSDSPAPYWSAANPQGLADALRQIQTRLVSCRLPVQGRLLVDSACGGTLRLGETELRCDENGWRPVSESEIELLGEACTSFQTQGGAIEASFPCGTVIL